MRYLGIHPSSGAMMCSKCRNYIKDEKLWFVNNTWLCDKCCEDITNVK